MWKNSLAPGFRFHPTDVEILMYYLKRKVLGKKLSFKAIAEVDIYKHAPWDLPDMSCLRTGDLKSYFYCPIEKKYARGARLNRATVYGYWKTTGKDRPVKYNEEVVGMIKTLVFHRGKAPRGDRTDWVMHEYRLEEKALANRGVVQDTYVLCVVFKKDGMGPRNGAQYGAPFKEEDWSDDEDVNLPGTGCLSSLSTLSFGGACSSSVPESQCAGPSVESSGLYTLPQTKATFSVPPDIDNNGYAAPTWSDDENANLLVTGFLYGMSTPATVGVSKSCVPESQCPGPSTESDRLYTLPQVVHANATISVTADIDGGTYAAPTCTGAPQVPVVADSMADPALSEAPQFAPVPEVEESNGSILSMLELFAVEDAFATYGGGQMTGNANYSFCMAPQFATVPEVEESNGSISSMLELFTVEDAFTTYDRGEMSGNANDSFCPAPQVAAAAAADDDDILSMLAYFREDCNLNNVLYPFE